jgi:hypothetical protein
MTATQTASLVFGSSLFGSVVGTFLTHWLTDRRTRQQEERQAAQKRREASIAVAEILGEWVRSTYTGTINEDRWRLQTMYWKNILLLDRRLLQVLFPVLGHQPHAGDVNDVIIKARQILLGLHEPNLTSDALNVWPPLPPQSPDAAPT